MRFQPWAAAVACALFTTGALAAELGMEAPELTGLEWVKGDPIQIGDGDGENIYIVEFWATWCGPCRASVPYLTELQRKFADDNVVIIGISDEEHETVAAFAESQGDEMDFRVAVAPERGPHQAYMEAFGQGGIPTAFVVDREGRVAWYGHPAALDAILPDIVDGSYDLEQARLEIAAMNDIEAISDLAFMGEQEEFHRRATAAGEKYGELPAALLELAWLIFNVEGMSEENLALGARLSKQGFEAMDEPSGVAYLVRAVGLKNEDQTEAAIAMITEGIEVVEDHQARLKSIMEMFLEEWEGGEPAALQ